MEISLSNTIANFMDLHGLLRVLTRKPRFQVGNCKWPVQLASTPWRSRAFVGSGKLGACFVIVLSRFERRHQFPVRVMVILLMQHTYIYILYT